MLKGKEFLPGDSPGRNWARVLAQIVYYFYSTFRVQEKSGAGEVRFCVPTGNFGNILAAWFAIRMGAPISQLILATNENDILCRFFNSGVYRRGQVVETPAPAMDIQISSNFERYLYYFLGEDAATLKHLMEGFVETGSLAVNLNEWGQVDSLFVSDLCTRKEILETIRRYYEEHNYILDPHTATGITVAERQGEMKEPTISVATAHPAKFPEAVQEATGKDLAHHPVTMLLHIQKLNSWIHGL